MNIGILHNAYRYRGGEERVAQAEARLLKHAGHRVSSLTFDNRVEFATLGATLRSMAQTAGGWNTSAAERITGWVRSERLDLVHVHNIYPFITAAGPDAVSRIRVPLVMTLHNFRPLCAAGTLQAGGQPCTRCVDGPPVGAIVNGCYRGSRAQSMSWAAGRIRAEYTKVWERVDAFIAPSEHVRDMYIRGGFPADRIIVRPHFTDITPAVSERRDGIVVIGRIEESKGVPELIRAWPADAPRLTVVGEGPHQAAAMRVAGPNVFFVGQLDRHGVADTLSRATVMIAPSRLPETFGLTLVEAAACRTPVVARPVGGYTSIIKHEVSGILAESDRISELIEHACRIHTDPGERARLGDGAFERYCRRFTPEAGLSSLLSIYRDACRPSGYAA